MRKIALKTAKKLLSLGENIRKITSFDKILQKAVVTGFIPVSMFLNTTSSVINWNIEIPVISTEPLSFQEENWQPALGDTLTVDVVSNMGYLVHENGNYFEFQVATGVKRYVYYIGMYYFAATPVREWDVKEVNIKGDRVTFGPEGRFLRLFYNGQPTPYGIHSFLYEDRMLSGDRYGSMGCIIPRNSVLDIIENTYRINGDYLKVTTVEGFDPVVQ